MDRVSSSADAVLRGRLRQHAAVSTPARRELTPPPFRVHLDLPTGWTVLEPARWRDQLASSPDLLPLPADARDTGLELLAEVLDEAYAQGVAVLAVHRRRQRDGRPFSASLTVGFHDSTPHLAAAELLDAVLGSTALERAQVPAGPVVLRRGVGRAEHTALFPHSRQFVVQAWLALTGTCWTAVVTGTTGEADHAPVVEAAVRGLLLGLHPLEPG
ncbi:MAG: hypothetical protein JWM64_412 [Frankiales bacterium]|nr:hypothetical protein [Frankiales bacterium]